MNLFLRARRAYRSFGMCLSLIVATFLVATSLQAQTIKYVTPGGAGTKSGASWSNAYDSVAFRSALSSASSGTTFWLAAGTYIPGDSAGKTPKDPRQKSFTIPSGVSIYGGFAGSETSIGQRIFGTNITMLSGDIGVFGSMSDNCYNVVRLINIQANVLDRLTIALGNANGSTSTNSKSGGGMFIDNSGSTNTLTLNFCTFIYNYASTSGGGLYCSATTSGSMTPSLLNCNFSTNSTGGSGGGAFFTTSGSGSNMPSIINGLFTHNLASANGGGLDLNIANTATLTNCDFYIDSATTSGGALYNSNGRPTITNSIFWNDGAASSKEIKNANGAKLATVTYSDVEGGYSGTSNLNTNPNFVSPGSGNYLLKSTSTLINVGNNAVIPEYDSVDIAKHKRIQQNTVDIGSYEYSPCTNNGSSFSASVCSGSVYTYLGTGYTAAGTYYIHLINSYGCDSLITFKLTLLNKSTSTTNATICSGQSYTFNGTSYTTAGTYVSHLTNAKGCDSAATLNLTVNSSITLTLNQTICQGQTYTYNGSNYTTAGTYTIYIPGILGLCGTSVTLNLAVTPASSSTVNASICSGHSYSFNGKTYTVAGTYKDTLVNKAGCDSIVTLNLTLLSPTSSNVYAAVCPGQTYNFNGTNYTCSNAGGTYTYHTTNKAGCDSTVTLYLSAKKKSSTAVSASICQGQSYAFNGSNYTGSGTYTATLTNSVGCDSTITLTLTVKSKTYNTVNAFICSDNTYGFWFNGHVYTNAGTYTVKLTNSVGCDSVITLNLAFYNTASTSLNAAICNGQSYSFNGSNYTTAGSYTAHLKTSNNCDSAVTLNLTVNNQTSATVSATICNGQSYSFNGQSYSSAGSYLTHLTNAKGCDSAVTLNLTVNNTSTSTVNAAICNGQSYSFNGSNYSSTGTYYATLTNALGCDSVVALNLTINYPTYDTIYAAICPGGTYGFNGTDYTTAGTYSATLTNSNGCDSIATVILTIKSTSASTVNATIVQGQTYTFNGTGYTTAGTYTATLINSVGCDSVVTLTLNVLTFKISGRVYDDGNGMTDNTVNGTPAGTIGGVQLYANLLDSNGNVITVQTLPSNGTFSFTPMDGVVPGQQYYVSISSTAGTVGNSGPSTTLPSNLVNTGENYGNNNASGSGNDAMANGWLATEATNSDVTNVIFGINQIPTAGNGSQASQLNPGGSTSVSVPASTFTNGSNSSDPENELASITITGFPTNATSITINGTTYTSGSFPAAGVIVPCDGNGNPTQNISVDPINGSVIDSVPFISTDSAGANSSNIGYAILPFTDLTISGGVYDDGNGMSDATVNGTAAGTIGGTQLYANLLDNSGNVIAVKTLPSNGTFTFTTADGVQANAADYITISTTAGTVGSAGPSTALPSTLVNTGENYGSNNGSGSGNDGTVNGSLAVDATSSSVSGVIFGINQIPTAGNGTQASQVNPGGTTSVSVSASTFTNGTNSSDPESQLSSITITSFPTNATSITINGTTYTSGSFPVAGVTVPCDGNGNPTQSISVDPINGSVTVSIPFVSTDAAGSNSSNTGHALVPFTDLTISGGVYDDGNGMSDATVNGTQAGTIGGTQLYANLLDNSGNVISVKTLPSNGTFTFTTADGVQANAADYITISTTAGTVGSAGPSTTLPSTLVNTGENYGSNNGSGSGNDGTVNSSLAVDATTSSVSGVIFGINQIPAAGNGTQASQVNPGGTTSVSVSASTFTNGTNSSDPESQLSSITITGFPTNATSITINGTTYTSGSFPAAGVTVPCDGNGNPSQSISVDPINGSVTVSIPFVSTDAAGSNSSNTGHALVPFTDLTISGGVYDDGNGMSDATVNGTAAGTIGGTQLYANLLDNSGNVIAVKTLPSNGTFTFTTADGVQANAADYITITTTAGTVGSAGPSTTLPSTLVNTGENYGSNNASGSGNDGTVNGSLAVDATTSNVTGVIFGINQIPTAGNGTQASQVNPGGTTSVSVSASTFTNGTVSSDPESQLSSITITGFPTNATSITINGTTYTSGSFPVAGVTVPCDGNGNPSQSISVDPINGSVTVSIPFVSTDAAGSNSSNTGHALVPFTDLTISGGVYDDGNGMSDATVNGTQAGTIGGTQLYANLLDNSGNVIAVKTLPSNGTFTFTTADGVQANAADYITITTTAGTVGSAGPSTTLPSTLVNTGENYGSNNTSGSGNDGTVNGSLAVDATTSSVSGVIFGINQIPTAGNGTQASQANPGGTTSVSVSASTFTNGTNSSDPESQLSSITITGFPTNATSITINGTTYTSGSFPVAGVTVPCDGSGNPSQNISIDPINGSVTVSIPFVSTDAAGSNSSNTGHALVPFTDLTISGGVYDDGNGMSDATVNGTAAGTIGGTQLYANLLDNSGNVIAVKTLPSNGTFTFTTADGVQANASDYITITTTAGTVGSAGPSTTLPSTLVNTGENYGSNNASGSGNDGTVNGSLAVDATTSSVSGVIFGINQIPTAGNGTQASQANPGGTTSVSVSASTFTNGTNSSDPESQLSSITITGFPTNATSITINGTTYTSGSFPAAGVTVPCDGSGNPSQSISVDPINGSVTVSIPFISTDAAGSNSSNTGHALVPFTDLTISGGVYDDGNGMSDATVNGTAAGTIGGTQLYANLLDNSGNVIAVKTLPSNGTFTFTTADGIQANAADYITITTTAGTVGSAGPSTTLPSTLVNTGENYGSNNASGSGNDGTVNGSLAVDATTSNVTGVIFGINQIPTAGNGTQASQVNPGGTTSVSVSASTFTNGTNSSDPESQLSTITITGFPTNATSITINGTTYTSGSFPVAGVTVPCDGSGNPSQSISVDPINGSVTVSIPFVSTDAAGSNSSNTGHALVPFTDLTISGGVYDDGNGMSDATVNGTAAGTIGGTQLYANLLDNSGNVIAVKTLPSNGTFTFTTADGVQANAADYITITTTAGTAGSAGPSTTLPSTLVNTGENYGSNNGSGSGNDGTVNGSLAVDATTSSVSGVIFGINQIPTAGNGTQASQVNPGGTTSVSVSASTFTNGTNSSDPESQLSSITITGFPTNATSITINGTTYTSGSFPVAGVTVPCDGNGNPSQSISVDPINGSVTVSIPFVSTDAAGSNSSNTGHALVPFMGLAISGGVYDDGNGMSDATVNGTQAGTIGGTQLYANLLDNSGNVIAVKTLPSNGTFTFTDADGVQANAADYITISTTAGTVGSAGPSTTLPSTLVNTGENYGSNNASGSGNDGTVNGKLAVEATTSSVSGVIFGINQIPTAGNGTQASQANPGGTTSVSVSASTFTNGTNSSDPESQLSSITITGFPTNATSITINGTTYTSGSFPVAGVTVPCNGSGNPTQSISVDPVNGSVTVSIPFVSTDAAGSNSSNTGHALVPFTDSTTVYASICSGASYSFNGSTYATAGSYTVTIKNNIGNDSTVTLKLTVKNTSSSTTIATTCSNHPYTFNGNSYGSTGSYTVHLTNKVGCDSAATLNLTVKNTSSSTTTAAICDGQSYSFNGSTYTATGTYTATLTNKAGCDSVATLNLTKKLKSSTSVSASICNGQSYSFNGSSYTIGGTYTAHLTNKAGCDSAVTLTLTVKSLSTSSVSASICNGQSYSFNGSSYTIGGTYTAHLTNKVGCDSAVTLTLTVKSLSTSSVAASICNGQSYSFNGQTYTSAGSYTAHLTNKVGCDSAVTLTLTVKSLSTSSVSASICNGQSYSFNGSSYTIGGTYTAHLTNKAGCDSAVTLTLTVKSLSTSAVSASICNGQSYSFNGSSYTIGGTYTAHLTNKVGCDSAVTLTLTVKSLSTSFVAASICNGQSYSFNGQTYTSAGSYTAHLTNKAGCDSAVTLTLTVKSLSASSVSASICNGQSYSFNGQSYTTAGSYTAHLTNKVGCDSAVTLTLAVKSLSTSSVSASICNGQSYSFNGSSYTIGGTYTAHLTNKAGCDSAVTLTLTVKSLSTSSVSASICNGQSYTFNGSTYTTAGTYTAHKTNKAGCDSAITLTLTVKSLSTSSVSASICNGQSYTFNGTTYTTGGTYTAHLTNKAGCDSAITLTLTVKSLSTSSVSASICNGQSYSFNGSSYTIGGTYTAHLTNKAGCDSAVTLTLTVKSLSTSSVSASICNGQSYSFNGSTYTSAGTYTAHLTNKVGCDSAVTLTLTVKATSTSTVKDTICTGNSITFNGTTYTTGGTYTIHLTNKKGCDSAITFILTINSTNNTTINASICQGQTYSITIPAKGTTTCASYGDGCGHTEYGYGCGSYGYRCGRTGSSCGGYGSTYGCHNGTWCYGTTGRTDTTLNYTAGGTYTITLGNKKGCDSVITLNLTIKNKTTSSVSASICNGQSYSFNGSTYTTGGTYTAHLTNKAGCDSAITLTLAVKSLSTSAVSASICNGQSYSFNGSSYTTGGTYTAHLTNKVGCDSAVTLTLTVKATSTSTVKDTVCTGNSITFNGTTYTTGGTYTIHLTNKKGCDSAITFILTLNSTSNTTINASICQGQTYSITIPAKGTTTCASYGDGCGHTEYGYGCGSYGYRCGRTGSSCGGYGSTYGCHSGTWCYGTTGRTDTTLNYTAGGTYTITLGNKKGCDSVITLNLTIKNKTTSSVSASICNGQSYSFNGSTYTTGGTYTAHLTNKAGCDSAITLTLTVKSLSTSSVSASICNGQSYSFNGSTYTTGGTYTAYLTNKAGCDSAITLTLTVKSLSTSAVSASICNGQSYTLNGTAYTTAGTYTAHLTNKAGCDSAVTLTLTVKATSTSTVKDTVCSGNSITFNGTSYNTAGTYTVHVTNKKGCDSAITFILTTNTTSNRTINASICQGQSYTLTIPTKGTGTCTSYGDGYGHSTYGYGCGSYGYRCGHTGTSCGGYGSGYSCHSGSWTYGTGRTDSTVTYTSAGTYTITLGNKKGCDSVITLNLTVKSATTGAVAASICQGGSYTYNGTNYTCGGTYTIHLTNKAGCDSAVTLTLTVKSATSGSVSASICPGKSYTYNGTAYTCAGTYTIHLTNKAGCDSAVTLCITNKSSSSKSISASICSGSSYSLNGTAYTSAGTYTATLTNKAGCDSVVTLCLTVNTSSTSTVKDTVCSGNSITFNGTSYNTAGTYTVHVTNKKGCDSAITFILTTNTTSNRTINASICQGQSYTLTIPAKGTGTCTSYGDGCGHSTYGYGCGSYGYRCGRTGNSCGGYGSGYSCHSGCWTYGSGRTDSTVTYTSAGTYTITLGNKKGCDSVITLNLTVKNTSTHAIAASFCSGSSYIYNGTTYTCAGTYTIHLTNKAGCDSAVTLTTTVKSSTSSSLTVGVCPGKTYSFNSIAYGTGTYSFKYTNKAGCDSFFNLAVVAKSASTGSASGVICSGTAFVYNGTSYTTAGTYTVHFTNKAGCDSAVTLTVTSKSKATTTVSASICQGSSYTVGSTSYTTAGTYVTHLTTKAGCDSAVTLNLTVKSKSTTTINASICNGQTYKIYTSAGTGGCGGTSATYNSYTTAGTYTVTLTNKAGCDSVITLNLTVKSTSSSSISVTINSGQSYSFNGSCYSCSGTYTATKTNKAGCDSIITLYLTVQSGGCGGGGWKMGTGDMNGTSSTVTNFTPSFTVYPNPNNGNFTVDMTTSNVTDNGTMQLFDMSGKLIKEDVAENSNGKVHMMVTNNDLAAGSYIVRITLGGKVYTSQVAVQK